MPAKRPYVKAKKRKQGHGRKTKMFDPKKPKYKGAAGNKFQSAYNNEIFQYNLPPQSADFGAVAAVENVQSKNLKVFLGALYNRNTTATNIGSGNYGIRGQFLTPRFYTDKYRVSFADIVPDHADSAAGFLLRMHVVQVKITPSKASVRTDSINNWAADIEALVNKELALSNIQSDHLEFARQNRNVKIIKTQLLKPSRNNTIRMSLQTGTTGENYSCPAPICLTVKHQIPQFKQRVGLESGEARPMLTDMYINAVCFECNNLTLDTGTFKIEHSSKFYYCD